MAPVNFRISPDRFRIRSRRVTFLPSTLYATAKYSPFKLATWRDRRPDPLTSGKGLVGLNLSPAIRIVAKALMTFLGLCEARCPLRLLMRRFILRMASYRVSLMYSSEISRSRVLLPLLASVTEYFPL